MANNERDFDREAKLGEIASRYYERLDEIHRAWYAAQERVFREYRKEVEKLDKEINRT